MAAGVDLLREFASWLGSHGSGVVGKSLFFDAIPDETTGAAVFVLELRSPAPALTYGSAYIRRPRFQIDVRSTGPSGAQADYPDITTARNLAQTAYSACLAVANSQIASTGASPSTGNWLFAIPESEPYLAGRDARNRVVFSFTVGCERQGP